MRGKASRSGPGGEISEAPPVADAARRFRGSAPIGGRDSGRQSVGTTVGKRTPPLRRGYKGCGTAGRCRHRPLRNRIMGCVGEGLCPSRGRPQGSPLRRGYKRCGEVWNPPVTTSPCQPPLGKGAEGTGDADCHTSDIGHWFAMTGIFARGAWGRWMRIATTSLRTGLAMTPFTRGAAQHRRADRGVRPYG